MNALVLMLAALTGPLPDAKPTLTLKVHLWRDHRSVIARHELNNSHPWWAVKRAIIQQNYRLVIDDEANEYPTFQIGAGSPREKFAPGAFAASGSFIRTLSYIAARDQWARENGDNWIINPNGSISSDYEADKRHRESEPEAFPPQPVPPPTDHPIPDEIPVPEFENPPPIP